MYMIKSHNVATLCSLLLRYRFQRFPVLHTLIVVASMHQLFHQSYSFVRATIFFVRARCCGVSVSNTRSHYRWGSYVCSHGDRLSQFINQMWCKLASPHRGFTIWLEIEVAGDWSILLLIYRIWMKGFELSRKSKGNFELSFFFIKNWSCWVFICSLIVV